jgi:hypothetical protein
MACVVVGLYAYRPPFDRQPSKTILALPIAYHSICLLLIIYSVGHSIFLEKTPDALVNLLVAIPLALTVGFLAFGWASLERLFPRPRTEPQPRPQT